MTRDEILAASNDTLRREIGHALKLTCTDLDLVAVAADRLGIWAESWRRFDGDGVWRWEARAYAVTLDSPDAPEESRQSRIPVGGCNAASNVRAFAEVRALALAVQKVRGL